MILEVVVHPEHRVANDMVREYRDEVEWAGGFAPGVHWDVYSTAKDVYLVALESGVRLNTGYLLEVVSHLN